MIGILDSNQTSIVMEIVTIAIALVGVRGLVMYLNSS